MDREELCALIPHGGGMCLLDRVTFWDPERIVCTTRTHLNPDNPLRSGGELPATGALEYGAQAMAVHGGLLAREQGRAAAPGWLASVRDARFAAGRLDTFDEELTVEARARMSGGGGYVYDVSLKAGDVEIAAAQLIVAVAR